MKYNKSVVLDINACLRYIMNPGSLPRALGKLSLHWLIQVPCKQTENALSKCHREQLTRHYTLLITLSQPPSRKPRKTGARDAGRDGYQCWRRVRKPQITTINHPAVNIFTWCGRAGIGNSQSSLERSQQNNPLAQTTLSAGIWQVR